MATTQLTRQEEAALERVRRAASLLDDAIRVPGTDYRVGIDPIMGILPVSGDLAAAVVSLYIVAEGVRLGVPRETIGRMLANVAVDTVGGSVPVLGTVFDAAWKANARNVELIESHLGVDD